MKTDVLALGLAAQRGKSDIDRQKRLRCLNKCQCHISIDNINRAIHSIMNIISKDPSLYRISTHQLTERSKLG